MDWEFTIDRPVVATPQAYNVINFLLTVAGMDRLCTSLECKRAASSVESGDGRVKVNVTFEPRPS